MIFKGDRLKEMHLNCTALPGYRGWNDVRQTPDRL